MGAWISVRISPGLRTFSRCVFTVGRMNDEGRSAAQDRVIAVLARNGVANAPAFAEALERAAIVPAAGALAEVAADGPDIADLVRRDHRGGFGQHREVGADEGILRQVGNRRHRADGDDVALLLDLV